MSDAAGEGGTSDDGEVAVGGRRFTLGAAYRPGATGRSERPRRLVRHDPVHEWPGGRVEAEVVPSGARRRRALRRWMSGEAWARWAGAKVEP